MIARAVVRARDVAALDAAAAALGIAGSASMARAGRAIADAAAKVAPEARRIVVLAGPGNNGGDGYEAAALLRARGLDVAVLEAGDARSPLAAAARARLLQAYPDLPRAPFARAEAFADTDLWIDALLGAGTNRPVEPAWATAFALVRASGAPVLAVDVPSGLDADRARPIGPTLPATATVQLSAAKPASLFAPTQEYFGRWRIDDLGLPEALLAAHAHAWLVEAATLEARGSDAHKFSSGVVLIAGGSSPYPGAAELAARAAFRAGAGYVVAAADARVGAAWPEIVAQPLAAATLAGSRADVAVIGPGLAPEAGATLLNAWGERPAVLDGGMLHAEALAARGGAPRILTPHPGEAARLLGVAAADVAAEPIAAAVALARAQRAWVTLKLSATVVAAPDGSPPFVVPGGGAALAVAGTGDVLAGTIGAVLAAHFATGAAPRGEIGAAIVGAVALHALAARLAAAQLARGGPIASAGLIAGDVIDALPAARGFLERRDGAPPPPWRW